MKHYSDVIIAPVITEKSMAERQKNVYTFKVVKDEILGFNEGARVSFVYNDTPIFLGTVFEKKRDKDQHIEVVAYDQLRYFKNNHAYVYENIRADQFLKLILDDFLLKGGTIENTGWFMNQVLFDNHSLFDMIQSCIDETLMGTGKLYCLYDDYGKICFRNIHNMVLDLLIDKDTAENFDYTTSIDSDTYNRVMIQHTDSEKGIGNYVVSEDYKTIKNWGVLQKFEAVNEWNNEAQLREKAKHLLELHNRRKRTLSVNGCIGDVRCRAGTSVYTDLALGDLNLKSYMLVEEAKHTFENNYHSMDLKLSGASEFYE